MNNEQLITKIRDGDDKVIQNIYIKYRDEFVIWANKYHQCDYETGKEVYQQCIVQLYENVVNKKLTTLTSDLKTYLFGVGKNKVRELKEAERRQRIDVKEESVSTEDKLFHESMLDKVEGALLQLGDPCKKLLKLFYYRKMNLVQITEALDYKNTDTTKNLKYKCLGRLRKIYTGNA